VELRSARNHRSDASAYPSQLCGVAGELYIREGTVLPRLNLRDRVQAVVLANQTGLLEPDTRHPGSRDQSPPGE